MKILHIIPSVSPVRGGTSTAVLGEVKALNKHGIEAEILTTNDHGNDLLNVPFKQKVQFDEVPVWFVPKFSPNINSIREFCFSGEFAPWLWQNIDDYDLIEIHSLFSYTCTMGALISRQKNKPYIINPHGHFLPWVINQKRWKKEIYAFLVEKSNLNYANGIRCTSTGEVKDVMDFGIKTPTFTVPLGIEKIPDYPDAKIKLRQKYNIPETTPIILFFSRLHPKKRPDLLLQVLAKIKAENLPFHLILAGNGDEEYADYIKKMCTELDLESQTTFPGLVTEEKALFLRGADIFVLPSFAENFALAVAESMTVGVPVIITPEVQIADDISDGNAGLIIPGELDFWVTGIKQLLLDKDLREKLGKNAQKLAQEKYTWDNVAKNLISVYNRIINNHN